LYELRKELRKKNAEIRNYKKESDVWKSLSEKQKEEKELGTELRALQKEIKSLGGEFKIPINRKKRTKKPSKNSKKGEVSKRKRDMCDGVVVEPKRKTLKGVTDTE
jgi:septal ring factor EnvC (AmiA/AmiB activator)